MILYNVTINVDDEIIDEWLVWMKKTHLPEVMATGKFISYEMYKIQNHNPMDLSNNYSVQYYANSLLEYEDYLENYAPALKQKTIEKYGEQVNAFRTLLEKIA
ncbi:MAG: DUF4286 family protein [Bacteroidia bacterium]